MHQEYPTPCPRSYWVIPARLLAGAFPGDKNEAEASGTCRDVAGRRSPKLQALFDAGIRCIVNLMEPDERDHQGDLFADYAPLFKEIAAKSGERVSCRRFPVPDLGVPDIATMQRILDTIDAAIADRIPVYVHCWGGIGRTGTVVGCFLIRRGLAEGETVIERIHDLRYTDTERHRPSPETRGQIEFVRSWDRHEKIRLR
jgi:hypothetical protein